MYQHKDKYGRIVLTFLLFCAAAADAATKPEYCYVLNPGNDTVEVAFVPSKLVFRDVPGNDNASYYRIERKDGSKYWELERDDPKNIKDTGNFGYSVHSIDIDTNARSNPTPCIRYRVVSSISPGKLVDWRRSNQPVIHGQQEGKWATGYRNFSGTDQDIVTSPINDSQSSTLNPDGGLFSYQAKVSLTESELDSLASTPFDKTFWNIIQRGLADSDGGQWKMSLVMRRNNEDDPLTPRAQCLMKDGDGNSRSVTSSYVIKPGQAATITCVIDDRDGYNSIQIIVNARADGNTAEGSGFGNVNPDQRRGSNCARKVSRTISIGNMPVCGSQPLKDENRFRGRVEAVRIFKGQ